MTTERGQISFDFAIGVSLLVISMMVAVSMVPGLFDGVTESRVQGDNVAADRVASHLANGWLGSESRPNRVDTDCLIAFLDGPSSADGSDCGYGSAGYASGGPLSDRTVNVTVRRGEEIQCWDDDARGRFVDEEDTACDAGDFVLAAGGHAGTPDQVMSASRSVTVEHTNATILVRVW